MVIRIFNNIEEFASWIMNIVGCVGSVPWLINHFLQETRVNCSKYEHAQTIACVHQLGFRKS